MAITELTVSLTADTVARIQHELRARGLGGWLLYDFHGSNPVAARVLGLPALTRRYFVLIPADGDPVAVTHRIEQQPWTGWIGENRPYLSWRELQSELGRLLGAVGRVATEYTPDDTVPYVDLVPAGVIELIRGTGAEPVPSADLVSAFHSRWSAEGLASHRRAAVIVQETAHAAFERVGESLRSGGEPNEWETRQWVKSELERRGLKVGAEAIVAVNANAANPHYAPSSEQHAPIRRGDLLLIDLFGKEQDDALWADQTWMAYLATQVPERLAGIFAAVRDAREAAVTLVRERWAAGTAVAGYEVDDASRAVIVERGYGEAFIHRTGHSIDRELHGSGPNIDNLETRDTRELIQGIGFSVEPGIYLPGDVGFRTEIDVYMGPDGPEVTTPEPQREIQRIQC
jgi:Xaa-Pro dipeptidase